MNSDSGKAVDLSGLSPFAAEIASTFASISSDIALIVDRDGVVRSAFASDADLSASTAHWVGRNWAETVSSDTRRKIDLLLEEVRSGRASRRREVNHRFGAGQDLPFAYTAIQLGANGPVLAVGRDLRNVAAIQQRFLDAQKEMERHYWSRRNLESRYRLLYGILSDAVLTLDAATLEVTAVDAAATELLGGSPGHLGSRDALSLVQPAFKPALAEMLAMSRVTGKASEAKVRLAANDAMAIVSSSPFRDTDHADSPVRLLVRVQDSRTRALIDGADGHIREAVDQSPVAVVVVDASGRIVMSNAAFIALCGADRETQVEHQLLEQVIGDADRVVMALIRDTHGLGLVTQRATRIGVAGLPVSMNASLLFEDGDQARIAIVIRPSELPPASEGLEQVLAQIEQTLGRLGRESFDDMIGQVSVTVERHLLNSALARHRDDPAAAARWLGLSVSSLKYHLRRHGLSFDSEPPYPSAS